MKRCNSCSIENLKFKSINPKSKDEIYDLFRKQKNIKDFIEFIKKDKELLSDFEKYLKWLVLNIFDLYNITPNIIIDIEYDYKIKNLSIYIRLIIITDDDFKKLYDIAFEKSELLQKAIPSTISNYLFVDVDAMTNKEHTKIITTYDKLS